MKKNRMAGFAVIAVIYVAAIGIGILIYRVLPELHIFLRILAGDIGATILVYLAGVFLKNASVYDPYWSVAPLVILTGIALDTGKPDAGVVLLLVAVWIWGVRLTTNWAYTFKNLTTQDWRYDDYKQRYPRMFQLISFFGINLVPTAVVYLCMLPGVVFVKESAWNVITVLGFIVCIAAATLQLAADLQMHRFRRRNTGSGLIMRSGLWKYARHPNYFGEILMWWGVYIIMLSAAPDRWGLLIGPAANTLMFLFISIPLADKRNRKIRQGFDEYYRETRHLLPIKKRI